MATKKLKHYWGKFGNGLIKQNNTKIRVLKSKNKKIIAFRKKALKKIGR